LFEKTRVKPFGSEFPAVSLLSWQGTAPQLRLFEGSESNRIDDHQKYLLGVSRSTRKEW
jgi:hypothetical protein